MASALRFYYTLNDGKCKNTPRPPRQIYKKEGKNIMSSYVTRKTPGDTAWFTHDRFGMFIHWGL